MCRASQPQGEPSAVTTESSITILLQDWAAGGLEARDRLFEVVYPELQKLARRYLAREANGISLATTDLVHETYFKLTAQQMCDWHCRNQFFALAATFLRRILVDHAKKNRRHKRGRGVVFLSLDEAILLEQGVTTNLDLLALDQALVELAGIHMLSARLVELHFFAGMSFEDAADVLGVSRATVMRKWRFARAWLSHRLGSSA